MTPAKIIKFPTPQAPGTPPPEKASFTRLDNATDLAALYGLPNALLKPALCLLEHRNMRPLHWGEVATTISRGATQTREALRRLAELGHAVTEGDAWAWAGSTAARKLARKSVRKPGRKPENLHPEKTVWVGVSFALKEVKEGKKENNNFWTGIPAQAGGFAVGVGGISHEEKTQRGQANQAALAAEGTGNAPPSQEKTAHCNGENSNVTDLEKVPPAAAPAKTDAADPIRAAHAALEAAGLGDVWADWFASNPALSRNRVALHAQLTQFADWVAAGLGEDLKEHTLDIVSAGTFSHPFNALKARMERAKAVQDAQTRNAAELGLAYGQPQCQPGERRRDIDGRVWTVETVEYGTVIFEEIGAPQGLPDRLVALWAVVQ
ncbi:hypothetical protein ACFP81_06510 [Deinococcus lacus]|uniref:Uncharacterized protein n=1 Tax=Deinococcus lacus TaxID=392561 RepID=A0ABW1YE46_9DEIO